MVTLLIIISSAFLATQPANVFPGSGNEQDTAVSFLPGGQAKIQMEKTDRMIKVKGIYLGPEASDLSYKLTVQKQGKGGSSNNAQAGKFEVKPGQGEVVLSTSGFGVQPEDKYFIELQIFQGSELIAQDKVTYEAPATR